MSFQIKNLLIFSLIGCWLAGCAPDNDVSFARQVMEGLIRGRYVVRGMIDWPVVKILQYDVGREYSQYQSEEAKTGYQRFFISNFAAGFKKQGAKTTAFFNWRMVDAADPKLKIVGVNCYDDKTMFLFYVSRKDGTRKLVEIKSVRLVDKTYAGKPPGNSGAQDAQ